MLTWLERVDGSLAGAQGAAAGGAGRWLGKADRDERQARRGRFVALRPAADNVGALGGALAAKLGVDVWALGPSLRVGSDLELRGRGGSRDPAASALALRQLQAEAPPALQLQVGGADVVQTADAQRGQAPGVDQVTHRARCEVQGFGRPGHAGVARKNSCESCHVKL